MKNFNKFKIAQLTANIIGEDNVLIDEPMSKHTSFRIGGQADLMLLPKNPDQIISIIQLLKEQCISFMVMGNGTNLLVREKGIRGAVIKLYKNFMDYKVIGNRIQVQAGILLSNLAKIAMENGLSGMEAISGIPGTLGGAVTMNAGAYGTETKDIVLKTQYIDECGNIKEVSGAQHGFGNRTSIFQNNNGIVIESEVQLYEGNKKEIQERMNDFKTRRNDKQPVEFPSAGSVFKRPEGYFAGKLIEDCGLKGFRIGGAEISNKHCGFIINRDNASADDVIELIRFIKNKVLSLYGVTLDTEVRIIGE